MQMAWFQEAFPGKVPSEQRPEGSERVNPGCLGGERSRQRTARVKASEPESWREGGGK